MPSRSAALPTTRQPQTASRQSPLPSATNGLSTRQAHAGRGAFWPTVASLHPDQLADISAVSRLEFSLDARSYGGRQWLSTQSRAARYGDGA
ncbi:hypothetical protein NKDENANG_02748 [Candidatus Entotheonellaceae bacterium PAL068K]